VTLNHNRARQDRGKRGRRIDPIGTANNAAINPHPLARPGSDHPGRALGGDRSGTRRDHLAPALVAQGTRPRRPNIRAAGGATVNNVLLKEQTAGCGWFPWGESARSARA
jgi:hypothetical protein